jgi:hypothetical protein
MLSVCLYVIRIQSINISVYSMDCRPAKFVVFRMEFQYSLCCGLNSQAVRSSSFVTSSLAELIPSKGISSGGQRVTGSSFPRCQLTQML